MWNLKRNYTNELIYKAERDSQTWKTNLQLLEEGMGGRDSQGVWDGHVDTGLFKMDNQQGPTVQHMELCSMLCGSLDGRGVWGRMDTYVCMAKALYDAPEAITTLSVSCTPAQNKKVF